MCINVVDNESLGPKAEVDELEDGALVGAGFLKFGYFFFTLSKLGFELINLLNETFDSV